MSYILRSVIEALPQTLKERVYSYAKRYIDYYEGNNNPDISRNGEFRFLRKTIADCTAVFDVGANVGEWARLVLQINPVVRLHCFEPSKSTFEKLVSQPLPANVVCNNFGLSSKTRQGTLFLFGEASGMNSLYRRRGLENLGIQPQDREETIELETLDEYCSRHNIPIVDYLKLDVEGHELEVLRGGKNMLREGRIRIVQFEYGGCNIDSKVLLKDIFEFMDGFSYTFYKILPQSIQRVSCYSQRIENFQYSNWLLIHARCEA